MSIEEKRREAFEAWILDNHCGEEDLISRDSEGEYYSVGVAERWEMYNAALDSVVIELPYMPRANYANQHSFNCAIEAMFLARIAVESAGLKVKS